MKIIIGIGMFALVTMLLTGWGMYKASHQRETLTKRLLSKSASKVMAYLKSHDTISEKDIRQLIDGLEAGEFGSQARAVVQGDKAFTAKLVEVMLHDGLIEPAGTEKGKALYKAAG